MNRAFLSFFMLFAFRAMICISMIFVPIHLRNLEFTGWQIGMLMGMESITALISTVPMGVSNDLFSSRGLILCSFAFLAPAFFLISVAESFSVLVVVFVVMGICFGLLQISLRALIFKTTGDDNREKRMAVMTFSEHAGLALGSVLGGVLLLSLSLHHVFQINGLLFLLIIPLVFFLPKTRTTVFEPAAYRKEFFRRDVIFFATAAFLFSYHWGAEKTVYVLFLKESLEFSSLGVGIFVGVTVGMLALSSLFYGRLLALRRDSLKRLIQVGIVLSAVGHLMLALSTSKGEAYLFRIIHELGDSAFMVYFFVMTSKLFKQSRVGGGSGFIAQVTVVATFGGALISGALLESYGPRVPMIVASVLSLATLFFVGTAGAAVDDDKVKRSHRAPLHGSPYGTGP
ncbi:MAG: MFS transporter [Planctomycetota bacterium]